MTLTVFTLPNCVQCDATKRKLGDAPHTAVSLLAVPDVAEIFREEGLKQAPIIEVRDADGLLVERWTGYIPDRIEAYKPQLVAA